MLSGLLTDWMSRHISCVDFLFIQIKKCEIKVFGVFFNLYIKIKIKNTDRNEQKSCRMGFILKPAMTKKKAHGDCYQHKAIAPLILNITHQ